MDTLTFIEAIFAMLVGFYFSRQYGYVKEQPKHKTPNWRETYAEELKELEN